MTAFNKSVFRRTRGEYSTLYRKPRPIVVGLIPGDLIEFREHGRRECWHLPVDVAFRLAIERSA